MTSYWVDPKYIDERLRSAIQELNRRGYKTLFSCAGRHPEPEIPGYKDKPYITLASNYRRSKRNKIKSLLRSLGLRGIKFRTNRFWNLGLVTHVTFWSLGGQHAMPNGIRFTDSVNPEEVVSA